MAGGEIGVRRGTRVCVQRGESEREREREGVQRGEDGAHGWTEGRGATGLHVHVESAEMGSHVRACAQGCTKGWGGTCARVTGRFLQDVCPCVYKGRGSASQHPPAASAHLAAPTCRLGRPLGTHLPPGVRGTLCLGSGHCHCFRTRPRRSCVSQRELRNRAKLRLGHSDQNRSGTIARWRGQDAGWGEPSTAQNPRVTLCERRPPVFSEQYRT